jgi:transcriptional regulator with XRE-family HTH domain
MTIDEKKLYKSIGDKIRELRIERNYNQTELAQKIGLERTSVTNIETGKQKVTLYALYNISKSLDVSLNDLLPQADDLMERTLRVNDDHEVSIGMKTFAAINKLRAASSGVNDGA